MVKLFAVSRTASGQVRNLLGGVLQLCGVLLHHAVVPLLIVSRTQGGEGLVLPAQFAKVLSKDDVVAQDIVAAVGVLHNAGFPGLAPVGEEPLLDVGTDGTTVGVFVQAAVLFGVLVGAVLLGKGGKGIGLAAVLLPL